LEARRLTAGDGDEMSEPKTTREEFEVQGEHLLARVRELVHEGNVRRVITKREDGSTLVEVPLTAGLTVTVLTAAMAPVLVAIGAIAALVSKVTVVVERDADEGTTPGPTNDDSTSA
jgi:Domain of unknown function (DUF4342)